MARPVFSELLSLTIYSSCTGSGCQCVIADLLQLGLWLMQDPKVGPVATQAYQSRSSGVDGLILIVFCVPSAFFRLFVKVGI